MSKPPYVIWMNSMKKILAFLKNSHHWLHLLGGFVIGLLSLGDWYTAAIAGLGVASAMEFKDKSWGGDFDWADWTVTVIGAAFGLLVSFIIKMFLT